MTAAGIDALSGGRCILGLGASGTAGHRGLARRPLRPAARRAPGRSSRSAGKVWAREAPLTHDGPAYQFRSRPSRAPGSGKPLKIINHPLRSRIPIWVAALGEQNVAMTAEMAEGWLPLFFVPEKDAAMPSARRWPRARPSATRPRPAGDRCRRDAGHHRRCRRGGPAPRHGPAPDRPLRRRHGRSRPQLLQRPRQPVRLGGGGGRRSRSSTCPARRPRRRRPCPAELLEKTSLVGPEGYIKDRLAAYREAGVTVLNISPMGADPLGSVARLKELVS